MNLLKRLTMKDINSNAFEELRRIRTLLQKRSEAKAIQFISSTPNQKMMNIALDLALSFASINQKVVVVNLDFRTEGKLLKGGTTKGIEYYLKNGCELNDCIQPVNESVHLVAPQEVQLTSTDLLESPKLTMLIHHLRESYDKCLVVTSSLNTSYDALIVGEHCDGLVYVKEERKGTTHLISKHASLILDLNKPIYGILMTEVGL